MKIPRTLSSSVPCNTTASVSDATVLTLVQNHLSLVEAIVATLLQKYCLYSDPDRENIQADAFQSGVFGLYRAAEKFDPSLGKFSSYAWLWIEKYVRKELNDVCASRYRTTSLDAPIGDEEDGGCLIDTLPDADAPTPYDRMERRELHERLSRALSKLSERDRFIVESHYGFRDDKSRPFREIGEELNVTAQCVQSRLKKTLAHLHHEFRPVA